MELQKQCKLGLLVDLQLFYTHCDCSDEEFIFAGHKFSGPLYGKMAIRHLLAIFITGFFLSHSCKYTFFPLHHFVTFM